MHRSPMANVSSCSFSISLTLRFIILSVDSAVQTVDIITTTLGCLMSRHASGLSYNVLGTFHLPVKVMLPLSSMTLCMSLVGAASMEPTWVI